MPLKKDDLITELTKILTPPKKPDENPARAAKATAEKLGNAIHAYVTSGTVETSVQVEILPQSIQSLGSPGATAGPPLLLEVYGEGTGEIK
tara:strand:+ start:107 stop:379 length:273 start_codon:yes stop_codon:yes gene_type:complete